MNTSEALSGGALALSLVLVLFALSRLPRRKVSRSLKGLIGSAVLWVVGDLLSLASGGPGLQRFGHTLLYAGGILLPVFWWILALRWAEEVGVIASESADRLARLALAWSGLMFVVMLTEPWHGLFRGTGPGGPGAGQLAWWAMVVVNFGLVLATTRIHLKTRRLAGSRAIREQVQLFTGADVVTLMAQGLYVLGPEPGGHGSLACVALSTILVAFAMLRHEFLALLPALYAMAQGDPEGLVILCPDRSLVHANPRARELLAPAELLEDAVLPGALLGKLRSVDGNVPISATPGWEESWWKAVFEPGGALFRYGHHGERWLRIRSRHLPECGRGGGSSYVRISDVTADHQVALELRRSNRLDSLRDLSRGIAHDFRNLLAVIDANAELLEREVSAGASVVRRLGRIHDASLRATELADQLRLYAGASEPLLGPVDLSALAAETIDLLEPEPGRPMRIVLDLAPSPLDALADGTQMRQLLLNLLLNARESLPETGGEIKLSTGRASLDPSACPNLVIGRDRGPGDYAYLRVCDNGHGMEPEAQDRIFDPFYSTKGKHRGIGLSIVLGIVRSHQALLELGSQKDCGSEFTVYLRP